MVPKIIAGGFHSDQRGILFYNNDFDASLIKRIYIVENQSVSFIRAWQGHKIERRWFSVMKGAFRILLIKIDNWDVTSKDLEPICFVLTSEKLDVLYVPNGYVSSIQSLEENSKLLVMSDYLMGEINDEYRYDVDYFK